MIRFVLLLIGTVSMIVLSTSNCAAYCPGSYFATAMRFLACSSWTIDSMALF